MARSFWKKRRDEVNTASGYIKATDAVSRPSAALMTLLGILVIGGLLFGVFWGARWSFDKLAGNDDEPVRVTTTQSNDNETASSSDPEITATTSTSTSTPSSSTATTPQPATIPATTNNLPYTGPASNTAIFFAVLTVSYLAYRKKLLRQQ